MKFILLNAAIVILEVLELIVSLVDTSKVCTKSVEIKFSANFVVRFKIVFVLHQSTL